MTSSDGEARQQNGNAGCVPTAAARKPGRASIPRTSRAKARRALPAPTRRRRGPERARRGGNDVPVRIVEERPAARARRRRRRSVRAVGCAAAITGMRHRKAADEPSSSDACRPGTACGRAPCARDDARRARPFDKRGADRRRGAVRPSPRACPSPVERLIAPKTERLHDAGSRVPSAKQPPGEGARLRRRESGSMMSRRCPPASRPSESARTSSRARGARTSRVLGACGVLGTHFRNRRTDPQPKRRRARRRGCRGTRTSAARRRESRGGGSSDRVVERSRGCTRSCRGTWMGTCSSRSDRRNLRRHGHLEAGRSA